MSIRPYMLLSEIINKDEPIKISIKLLLLIILLNSCASIEKKENLKEILLITDKEKAPAFEHEKPYKTAPINNNNSSVVQEHIYYFKKNNGPKFMESLPLGKKIETSKVLRPSISKTFKNVGSWKKVQRKLISQNIFNILYFESNTEDDKGAGSFELDSLAFKSSSFFSEFTTKYKGNQNLSGDDSKILLKNFRLNPAKIRLLFKNSEPLIRGRLIKAYYTEVCSSIKEKYCINMYAKFDSLKKQKLLNLTYAEGLVLSDNVDFSRSSTEERNALLEHIRLTEKKSIKEDDILPYNAEDLAGFLEKPLSELPEKVFKLKIEGNIFFLVHQISISNASSHGGAIYGLFSKFSGEFVPLRAYSSFEGL